MSSETLQASDLCWRRSAPPVCSFHKVEVFSDSVKDYDGVIDGIPHQVRNRGDERIVDRNAEKP
jgi:hypothetical protein